MSQIQTDFEALQAQAVGPVTPTIVPEPRRGLVVASGNDGDPATAHSLGGSYAPPGSLADAAAPTVTRVFKDGPSGAANTITPSDGGVAATDVWEEIFENNAKAATYVLRASRGTVFHAPVYGATFTYQEFRPQGE